MILTRSRPAIHPKSTTLATCEARRFRGLAKRDGSRVQSTVTVHTIATHTLRTFRFNRMFELSALQDQRLQFPEWFTCQTGHFGDVSGTATCLQRPLGIHTSTTQHELPARCDQRLCDVVWLQSIRNHLQGTTLRPESTLSRYLWGLYVARLSKRSSSRVLTSATVCTVATWDLLASRCNRGFELSAGQNQRLHITECAISQTDYFGDVIGITVCLQCPIGIHTRIAQQNAYTYSLAGMLNGYAMVRCLSFQTGFVGCTLRCVVSDYRISVCSDCGFRAAHGGHAILFVLAAFIVGMTVCALKSESSVLDVAALTNPTLHFCLRV